MPQQGQYGSWINPWKRFIEAEKQKMSMTNISKRIPNSLYKRAIMPPERKNKLTLVFLL